MRVITIYEVNERW